MKNKKLIITLAITIILLIVLSVGAVAALYFTTDIFKTNEQIFWKYFSENSKIVSILNNENLEKQNELKNQNSYTTTGDLRISTQIGVSDPTEINIATTSRHDKNTGRTYADATLKKEDKDLLKFSYINSGNVYSIKCEDIYEYYIGFRNENLKQLFSTLGVDEEQLTTIPDSLDFENLNLNFKLDDSTLQHIREIYSNVILQNIPKESYQKLGKETIEINGTSYEANKYALVLESETLKQITRNFLETLKDDSSTINAITENINSILLTLKSEQTLKNEDISNVIESLLEDMDDTVELSTLTISVYEQKGKTIRTELEIEEEKIIIDLSDKQFSLLIPASYSGSIYEEAIVTNMQITFSKTSGQSITNSVIIVPNTNNPEETITLLATIGDTQTGTANNSYSLIINSISNDANTTQEINYDTQITATNQVEEIMELKDDNSVIINNYPIETLKTFFNGITMKAGQVLSNVLKEYEQEINALITPIYNVDI